MNELFEKICSRAIKKYATDLHFYLKDDLSIKFRIYGDLMNYDTIHYEVGYKLMNYIKYQAKINTNFRLKPQTGQFSLLYNNKEYYLRVSYLPTEDFQSIVIRILNNHKSLTIEELTPLSCVRDFLYQITHYSSGLFLISGATGSGKSTTLYTLLDILVKDQNKNIITIEDPIEMKKEACLQIELNEKLGITYELSLKQILRHDPDVIMIGEIRDEKTAKIAITCALTGHLVLSTIHASNAYLALKRLENLGVNRVDLVDVMVGSLAQRMRYDKLNKQVVVLPEFMSKNDINAALIGNKIQYNGFKYYAKQLIDNHHYSKELFEADMYE